MPHKDILHHRGPVVGASFRLSHTATVGDRIKINGHQGVIKEATADHLFIRVGEKQYCCMRLPTGTDDFFQIGNADWWTISAMKSYSD